MSTKHFIEITMTHITFLKKTNLALLVKLADNELYYPNHIFWIPRKVIRKENLENHQLTLFVSPNFLFKLRKNIDKENFSDTSIYAKELIAQLSNVEISNSLASTPKPITKYTDDFLTQVMIIDLYAINKFLDNLLNKRPKQTVTTLEPIALKMGISSQTLHQLIFERERLDRTRLQTLRKIQYYIDQQAF